MAGDAWIEDWLSAGRFGTYLRAAGGSRQRALELYEWNSKLSAAFLRDLSHLEVGLRNACDRQLSAAVLPEEVHWTDPGTLLELFPASIRTNKRTGTSWDANKNPRDKAQEARKRCASPGVMPVPGKIVAELMFGFWTYLVADNHENILKGGEIERRRITNMVKMLSPDAHARFQANSEVSMILGQRP
ncbi:hypothetical protein [Arthrobacter terricola]|uniref:hypothetical protein n=1 Tax=Arthrobacter terricola TaxID=2547396 RepID=UPI0010576F71|nr:hypothetical protein [Arthrobacter terricola]